MIAIAIGISPVFSQMAIPSAEPPAEERIVYINEASGGDVINDPAQPFSDADVAFTALLAAFPDGEDFILRLQRNHLTNFNIPTLCLPTVRIESNNATVRTINALVEVTREAQAGVVLKNIIINEVRYPSADGTFNSGHTWTGEGTATITTLTGFGAVGATGNSGSDSSGTIPGLPGNNGTSGEPPTAGDPGESVDNSSPNDASVGIIGTAPVGGSLRGTLVVLNLIAYGGAGGSGGQGGSAITATAIGGAGGNGGDYTGTDGNGARGGDGGNATCNGGDGGDGGNGADGATWLLYDTATVISYNVAGGSPGAGGAGGLPGTATAGLGGNGGNPGSNSGSTGDPGSPGMATANSGANGADGSPGSDGAVTEG